MSKNGLKQIWGGCWMFITLLCTGCWGGGNDAPTVRWAGTVTLRGKPSPNDVREAYIIVRPAENKTGMAPPVRAEIVKGQYVLKNVPKGEVVVSFHITRKTGKTIRNAGEIPYEEIASIVPVEKQGGIPMTAVENRLNMNFDL